MDYKKASENRKSIREYRDLPITEEHKSFILKCAESYRALLPEIEVELRLVTGSLTKAMKDNAGYEGLSFGAPAYLVLASEIKPGYIENAGYINEDVILQLTDAGLDTCWLTVDDGETMKKALGWSTDKKVTAVIAIGYGKKERSLTRLHIRSASDVTVVTREGHVAPKITLEDMIYGNKWGVKADLSESFVDDGLRNAFYAASYAPTFLNRQFIRFIMDGGRMVLVKKMDTLTGEFDARLNCGAVMLNFATVLEERRPFAVEWKLGQPDGAYEIPADCDVIGYCMI